VRLHAPGCRICRKHAKRWQKVAAELEDKVIVADVEVPVNKNVLKRFTDAGFVTALPTMLLFRDRKLYVYNGERDSVRAMSVFALEGYKKQKGSAVPPDITWVDEFLASLNGNLQHMLGDNPGVPMLFALMGVVLLVGVGILLSQQRWVRKDKSLKLP